MLEVGNGNLTIDEAMSHFALWAVLKAPLILGNDLRNIDNTTLSIISNPELISINQDKLGVPPTLTLQQNGLDIWVGPLSDGYVFAILNKNDAVAGYYLDFTKFNIFPRVHNIRDVTARKDLKGFLKGTILTLPPHGIKVIKASIGAKTKSA